MIDPVWKLYARAIERAGQTATLLEWDDRIPSFDEVHHEALKAKKFLGNARLRKPYETGMKLRELQRRWRAR